MKPIVFEGCTGWFHPAASRAGVVLCGAFGQEELFTHRIWRHFAQQLAAAGFATLRFDYHGTGNSAGGDEQPGRVGAWLDSVRNGVEWMRTDAGVKQIGMVGLRLGALLATCAAEEIGGVDALALMAGLTSGKTFVQEQRALDRFRQPVPDEPPPRPDQDKDIEAAGFVLTAETQSDLKRLDLLALSRPPAPDILLLNRTDTKPPVELSTRLRQLGAAVQEEPFPEYLRLLRTAHGEPAPERPFMVVRDWLTGRMLSAVPSADGTVAPDRRAAMPAPRLTLPGLTEEPVFLDREGGLFGVFAAAARPCSDPSVPVYLFVNNGAIHHVGTNRMSVMLARRLAARGIPSLRFDLAGIGDSASRQGRRDNLLYCEDSSADLRAALDWLERRGHPRCVVVGLCAGGALALTGAVRDRRIVGQILINPGRFFLGNGETTLELVAKTVRPSRDYVRMLTRPAAWRALLRAERNPAIIVQGLARRGLRTLLTAVRGQGGPSGRPGEVERWFRQLSDRGVATLMVYSVGDFTLGQLDAHLGKGGCRLDGLPHLRIAYLPGADHSLTRRSARERFIDMFDAYTAEWQTGGLPAPARRAS